MNFKTRQWFNQSTEVSVFLFPWFHSLISSIQSLTIYFLVGIKWKSWYYNVGLYINYLYNISKQWYVKRLRIYFLICNCAVLSCKQGNLEKDFYILYLKPKHQSIVMRFDYLVKILQISGWGAPRLRDSHFSIQDFCEMHKIWRKCYQIYLSHHFWKKCKISLKIKLFWSKIEQNLLWKIQN